ncbi:putative hydroxymethylpyrimidine transporter CytX [Desulfurococcus mucosus]|uniref:Hydroxymethylpyrimidine transporter CytX n=1 Tax=Desulfurococcus mucosus (strain ATCC 35584 / DSM 2162 / JCM 9187 / O7/1) TaxID=765177 RepID=E8R8M6_DESM0|nr:putative hydroxymethylpyrimidine transporter CytX [Desulfurococcus mucosus]ADV64852.1 hydroxymethylpyrimidine transporter CytX [Desulfurococcus mucosus DSM 2162]
MAGYELDLKPVPRGERSLGFPEVFSIWFGAGISIAEFWAGAMLVGVLGLNLPSAILATILGHLLGNTILAAVSLMGYYSGVPTMVLSRISLGSRGSIAASIANYLQLVGWTAVMLVVAARASETVLAEASGLKGWMVYSSSIMLIGLAVVAWALTGVKGWRRVELASAAALAVLSAWLTAVVASSRDLPRLLAEPLVIDERFWLGVDLAAAMPVSWAPVAADYSRFSRSGLAAFWGTYVGYFASSSLFYIIGALSNLLVNQPDPVGVIAVYGLGVPAMLLVVLSTTTTTFLDVYSAAISLKNTLPRIDIRKHIVVAGVLGIGVGLVFPVESYEWFLLLIGGVFTSLSGVMVADFLRNRLAYVEWRDPVVHVETRGLVAWVAGTVLYILLSASSILPEVEIPLFSDIGAITGSTLPSLAVSTLLALILG